MKGEVGVVLFGVVLLVCFGLYYDTPTAPLFADNAPAEKGQMQWTFGGLPYSYSLTFVSVFLFHTDWVVF